MTESASQGRVETLFLLGANVGDRDAALNRAVQLLEASCGPIERSATYATPPWGDSDQPEFLNVAARARLSEAPLALLRLCKEIEAQVGRTPTHQWGPREIDVDLIAYGQLSLMTPELTLPHPRLPERAFALVPLAELAPEWRHPLLDRTMRELLEALPPRDLATIRRMDSGAH